MILKALPKRTLFSLTLSATAIVVVYFWHIPNISYLNLSKTEVPTLVEPTITTKTWRSSPDIHHHHQEKVFKTHRDAKRKNNAGIFLSKSMYRKKKVKVPPLPQSLPYAAHLKSVHDIQHALWTTQLYVFLKSLKHSVSPHVNMVFGDSHHLDLVLNWIVAAHLRLNPPLHNIMVLSVDQPLCDFLASKKLQVTCIAVPSESILASTLNTTYEQGIKSRLVVLRVINFWGYDVASYDSDAILLRNPQPLIDSHPNVQVLGGASFIPRAFAEHHGIVRFAVCGGTLIVRSHPSTETLWKRIHTSTIDIEQYLWNQAMQDLGVLWNVISKTKFCKVQSEWQHYGNLSSVVFPQNMFCRQCCERGFNGYYIVHPTSNHFNTTFKHQRLKEFRSWFLQENWKDFVMSPLHGNAWLYSLCNKKRVH